MEFTLETADSGTNMINSCSSGEVKINGKTYHHSLLVAPNNLIENWPVTSVTELQEKDLQTILELKPAVVILGVGEQLTFPHGKTLAFFTEKQIGIEVMNTAAACRTYNVLLAEDRNVVAALII